jgi:hypothetical protein
VKFIVDQIQANLAELGVFMEDQTKVPFPKKILHKGNFIAITSKNLKFNPDKKTKILITNEAPGIHEFESIVKRKMKGRSFQYHTVESWELIIEMALNGFGVGIVPEFMVSAIADKCSLYVELTDAIKTMNYKIAIIHKGEHQLSKEAKLFLDTII